MVVHEGMMEPWCDGPEVTGSGSESGWEVFPTESDELKVAVVADLHLAGPGTAWVDRVRRESFMRSTFQVRHWKYPENCPFDLSMVQDEIQFDGEIKKKSSYYSCRCAGIGWWSKELWKFMCGLGVLELGGG